MIVLECDVTFCIYLYFLSFVGKNGDFAMASVFVY